MYKNTLTRALLIVLIVCTNTFLSAAQGKNFFISKTAPSWIVKVDQDHHPKAPEEVSAGYYISLWENQNHVELHENYKHVIREIISDAGVQNASELSVTYDPTFQKLIYHNITVWRNGSPIDKLDAGKFKILQNEKELSKFIYSGTFDAYMILDDIRKGDRIEYSYTIEGINPIFGDKVADDFYFESGSSVGHRYTNFIVSAKRKLTFKNYNFNSSPKVSDKNGLKLYEWEWENTDTYSTAEFEPSWYNPLKHTQISEYKNWNEVVNWGIKVNSYPDLKTPSIDKKVKELLRIAGTDHKKYMELAIRFVQDEVRYMGVEMGIYSQRPNSPEKVIQQRYGDCKDKSLLLIYLLKGAKINAYMAYADTYNGKKMQDFLPSPFVFNHAVVVIEYGGQKKWIDATIAYQRGRFDQIYFPDYGQGLVLKPGVKSPENVLSKPKGKLVADLTFDVGDTGSVNKTKLIIKSTYTGYVADDMRSTLADDGVNGIEKSFLDYISGYYADSELSAPIKIRDNEHTNVLVITESYLIPDIWVKDNRDNARYYANFYGDLISQSLRDITTKNRTQPLSLKSPVNIEQNIFVNLPHSWDVDNEYFESKTDSYEFKFNSIFNNKVMELHYSYHTLKDYVEAKDVNQYLKNTAVIDDKLTFGVYWNGVAAKQYTYNSNLLMLAALTLVFSGIYFLKVYQTEYLYDIADIASAKPIGGWWMITTVIGLYLGTLYLPVEAFESGIFYAKTWKATSGFNNSTSLFLHIAYVLLIIAYAIRYAWLILLIFLNNNRREIFPGQFTKFLIFSSITVIFEFAVGIVVNIALSKPVADLPELYQMITWIVFSIIWIVYLENSKTVRTTFVFTYPDLYWKTDLINRAKNKHNQNSTPNNNIQQIQPEPVSSDTK